MITLEREPGTTALRDMERCCFCRNPTPYWFRMQVAVCQTCAKVAGVRDVPSKAVWVRREAIANRSAR